MGAGHSVELLADQDAVSEQFKGTKCIMSASLDDLDPPVEPEKVLKELLVWLRRPVVPIAEGVLKSVDVTEHDGEDHFTVKVVTDGLKLDAYGFGRGDGADRVPIWKTVKVDRAKGCVDWVDHVSELTMGAWADEASETHEKARIAVTFVKNPNRLELVTKDEEGSVLSGDMLVKGMYFLTDMIVGTVQQQVLAKVKACVGESRQQSGVKSVIVEKMDEHVDYEGFFHKFVTIQREKFEKIPGVVIDDPTEGEFVTVAIIPQPDGSEKTSTNSVKHNVNTGSITLEMHDTEGILVNTMYWQLHKDPLQLEAWSITKTGERIVSESIARVVQFDTNQTIERANSWFG
uniref:Uncharacterized protein n=1 Tax=Zooxanthella nutricula TaxID=1333877 RepID=A0A6U6WU57_9DINO